MQLRNFYVTRGRVFAGRAMLKSEQLLRLQLAGLPVPEWTFLDRGKIFNEEEWGEYVVVKPEIGSRARGVHLRKTSALNQNTNKIRPFQRNAVNRIAQKVVYNTKSSKIRIQLFFGEIIYARQFDFQEEIKFENEEDMRTYEKLFSTENTQASNFESEEVFNLAKQCADTFDSVPMLALDVMLDQDGQPFFIEANPGGNTWHFSSAMIGRELREKGVHLEDQFDAFNFAGEILAQKAQELAT
jgi:glutathione synthase/RimK-type ligase-like ATP-grasp enzyme